MSTYSIEKVESKEKLIKFWIQAPDASIFSHPDVLPLLVDKVFWLQAYKGTEAICLWPLFFSDVRGKGISRFAYYVGPLWSYKWKNLPVHRRFDTENKIYSLFLEEFKKYEHPLLISFPPSNLDIRPFNWFSKDYVNYTVEIIPKYTAIITNLDRTSHHELLAKTNASRRQEIIKMNKNETLFYSKNVELNELFCLYKVQLEKKGHVVTAYDKKKLVNLLKIVKAGHGWISGFRSNADNKLVAINVILSCHSTANLVINLVDDQFKDTGVGTKIIFDSILQAKLKGISNFDFNGANSLLLSHHKHSFGAEAYLYFDLKFKYNL